MKRSIPTYLIAALCLVMLVACAAPAATTAPVSEATTAPTAESTVAATDAPATPEAATEITTTTTTTETAAIQSLTLADGTVPEETPTRIVCLYQGCMEYLAALGVTPIATTAWVAQWAVTPELFANPDEIVILAETADDLGFDLEELATLEPDLVIGWPELAEPMSGIAPLLVIPGAPGNHYQEGLATIRSLGELLGKSSEAEASIKAFEDRLAAYKELSPRDLSILQSGGDGENFWISTENSIPCSILNEVAICEWEDPNPQPGTWGYMASIEGVLQLDPDAIIFESWTEGLSGEEVSAALSESNPLWAELNAVKNNRVFADHGRDSYGHGTVGASILLDTYMPLLYPDTFPQALTDEEVQEILAN